MSNLTQKHNRELTQKFPPELQNLLEELVCKWDAFNYDKVIETHVHDGKEELRVFYVHEWVEPPTKSFRDFVNDQFTKWYFGVYLHNRSKYNMPDITADEINLMYRYDCLINGEHRDQARENPRDNGNVDEIVHLQWEELFRPTRTMSGVDPKKDLWHTKYWLL